jgi:hypothetical protein
MAADICLDQRRSGMKGALGKASIAPRSRREISGADDLSDHSAAEISNLNLSSPYPWAKVVPEASAPSAEDQAASQFFEKYVMYPYSHGSSPRMLEHLPSLSIEAKLEGRLALRQAVRAAAYASLSNAQRSFPIGNKALQCYGLALAKLTKSPADPPVASDDYTAMAVVILDLFEVSPRCCTLLLYAVSLIDIPRLSIYRIRSH